MAVDIRKEAKRCPDAYCVMLGFVDNCKLNNKICRLELGDECPQYQEFLEVERNGDFQEISG